MWHNQSFYQTLYMTKHDKLLPFVKKHVGHLQWMQLFFFFLTGWFIRTINMVVQFSLVLGFPYSLRLKTDISSPTQSLSVNLGSYRSKDFLSFLPEICLILMRIIWSVFHISDVMFGRSSNVIFLRYLTFGEEQLRLNLSHTGGRGGDWGTYIYNQNSSFTM